MEGMAGYGKHYVQLDGDIYLFSRLETATRRLLSAVPIHVLLKVAVSLGHHFSSASGLLSYQRLVGD